MNKNGRLKMMQLDPPFGLVKNITSEYQSPRNGCILLEYINLIENSNKFWGAIPDGKTNCIIIWGKNGYQPQKSQVIDFYSAETRMREKLNKGYKLIKINKLKNAFEEDPKWFAKVQGSEEFNAIIKASILAKSLDKDLSKPTALKSKLKI